jgi:hypothetical protein
MKLPSLGGLKQSAKARLELLRQQRFFHDKLSWAILVPTLFLNGLTLVLLTVRVHPTEFVVPVRYSNLVGFDQLGPWYQSYFVWVFAVATTLVNSSLAVISFRSSRLTSFFLMAGSFVVALFALVITTAFTAAV